VSHEDFQIEVIELGSRGVPLTVANVVAHLRVPPERVQRGLDRMAREGLVDVEVDENEGVVVYRVRGLSTRVRRASPRTSIARAARAASPLSLRQRPSDHKSVTLAVLLGALAPGIGLAYAAPLRAVLVATALVVVFGRLLGASLILGPLFWIVAIATSALFGALYALRYNQEGRRARLF